VESTLDQITPHLEDDTRQRRPGGRTADVTRRINQAVLELLAEGGIDACTFQNVAAKAGIERSTLYRRNPDRWTTIVDAIIDLADRETPFHDSGSLRADLTDTLRQLAAILSGPMGSPIMAVAAALQAGHGPGETGRFWMNRQAQIRPMFDAAIARGELPADVNKDDVFAMAAGPLFFRTFVIGQPVDDEFIAKVVDLVCRRYCPSK
jgi:AcrR family transcriptional regulator